jgi:hypothetical protein
MKKEPSKKLQLGKLKIASLSKTSQQTRLGGIKTSPVSICLCVDPTLKTCYNTNCLPSWCTEQC